MIFFNPALFLPQKATSTHWLCTCPVADEKTWSPKPLRIERLGPLGLMGTCSCLIGTSNGRLKLKRTFESWQGANFEK